MTYKKIKVGWGPLKVTVGWKLTLSHSETHKVATVGATAAALPGVPAKARAVVGLVAAGLIAICKAGGHDGVVIIYQAANAALNPLVIPR